MGLTLDDTSKPGGWGTNSTFRKYYVLPRYKNLGDTLLIGYKQNCYIHCNWDICQCNFHKLTSDVFQILLQNLIQIFRDCGYLIISEN